MHLENIYEKMSHEDQLLLHKFYERVSVVVLSTLDENSTPYSTPLYFCTDAVLDLYFFSDKKSQHSQHIVHNKDVSVGTYHEHSEIEDLKGVQLKGKSDIIQDKKEIDRIRELYTLKFNFITKNQLLFEKLLMKDCFRVKANWLKYIDNSINFGFKKEWSSL